MPRKRSTNDPVDAVLDYFASAPIAAAVLLLKLVSKAVMARADTEIAQQPGPVVAARTRVRVRRAVSGAPANQPLPPAVVDNAVPVPTPGPVAVPPTPKRRRRTKAEMAAGGSIRGEHTVTTEPVIEEPIVPLTGEVGEGDGAGGELEELNQTIES